MNAKVEKKIRREVKKVARKDAKRFSVEFVNEIQGMNLRQRLKFCWKILRIPGRKSS